MTERYIQRTDKLKCDEVN